MEVWPKNIAGARFASEQRGKKRKPADRLSEESTNALEAGVSYGKYKTQQYEGTRPKPAPVPVPKKEEPDPRLKYDLVCPVCGMAFKSMTRHRKYCSESCAEKQYRKFAKERKEAKRNGTSTNPAI